MQIGTEIYESQSHSMQKHKLFTVEFDPRVALRKARSVFICISNCRNDIASTWMCVTPMLVFTLSL